MVKAYPFLVSKNPAGAGWTGVAVPSIIEDSEAYGLLLAAHRSADLQPDQAVLIPGRHSKLGIFDLAYRQRSEIHTDGEGRPFRIKDGLVLLKRDRRFQFTDAHFDAVRDGLADQLAEFWTQTKWSDAHARSDLILELNEIRGGLRMQMLTQNSDSESLSNQRPRRPPKGGPEQPSQLRESKPSIGSGPTTMRKLHRPSATSSRGAGGHLESPPEDESQHSNPLHRQHLLGSNQNERAALIFLTLGFTLLALAFFGPPGMGLLFGIPGAFFSALGLIALARSMRR